MHLVKITAAPDLKAGAPLRSRGQGELAGVRGRLHPGERRPAASIAGRPRRRRRRSRRRRRCLPRRARVARSPRRRRARARVASGRLVLTLGKDWGATLSQIKSLAFYPYDDGAIEYAAPQTLTPHATDRARARDEARLPAAARRARFAACCSPPSRAAATPSPCPSRSPPRLLRRGAPAAAAPRSAPRSPAARGVAGSAAAAPRTPAAARARAARRSRRPDPESDALRVSGAVDQGHRPGRAGEEASGRRARQGIRVRRRRHRARC